MVDVGLDAIATAVRSLPARAGVAELSRAKRVLAGIEAELLAEHVTADGDTRAVEKLLGDGKTSRAETRRRARRAKANANSGGTLSDRLTDGSLSEEQADLIADADDKSNGAATNDTDFVDAIGAADPDQGRTIRDEWLAKRETSDGVESEHRRQRSLRRMQTYLSQKHGLNVISLEGDGVAHRRMVDAIRARADEIYRRDGGRGLPRSEHPRTRTQREFDAALELLCGLTTTPDGRTKPSETSAQRGRSQAKIVIGLTVDKLCGRDPAEMATQVGLGLIPDTVLADYAEHGDIIAALFDRNGEQLWQARLARHATPAQHIALVLRDRGCVLCGTDHTRCEAHHLTPWNAPARGRTDLDQLALLWPTCHHRLHDDNHTLKRKPATGCWTTRPATPDETPHRHRRPGHGHRPPRE